MTSPTKTISSDIARRLEAAGIPPEKHAEKVGSLWWYVPATAALLGGLGFCIIGVVLALRDQVNLLKAVMIFVPAAACFFASFYCATQASAEGLKATIVSVLTLGRGARSIVKGNGSPPAA